jgi:hypothetical protein
MVGVLQYFPSEADALANTNTYGSSGSYTVGDGGPYGGYTYWRLASTSTGSSSQLVVYPNGAVLNSGGGFYRLYPAAPCFLEGTKILCKIGDEERYVCIESLKKGDLVKTSRDGYKKVELVGKGEIQNPGNDERIESRLYKCSPSNYPELSEDIYITGCHSILVDNISDEEREKTVAQLGKIFITDKKYRLMAVIDKRAEPWVSEGKYTIWHLALENEDVKMNYGIYACGLLVETCSIHSLKNRSNMNC